jgi:hypothetical protein
VFTGIEGMSRKHFRAIANALKTNEPNVKSEENAALFKSIVYSISNACRSFNPRFDGIRFQRACGLDSISDR